MDKKKMTKIGEVVSDKSDKTVSIVVLRVKEHPIYRKKYTVSKKLKAHDEKNEYRIGDKIEIAPCRPISRDKKYVVLGKLIEG